jgi:RimJ/RimL family protein N-acetyltransferase
VLRSQFILLADQDGGTSQETKTMRTEMNQFGQPVGDLVPDWTSPPVPTREQIEGRFCRLEPLTPPQHGPDLFVANDLDSEGRNWTYLPYGPFASFDEYLEWLKQSAATTDPLFYAIIDLARGRAVGLSSYLRIDPGNGSIEIGHLNFSPLLQETTTATEAMYLMMKQAFDLGYRRCEWKCHALNLPSRRAALRLGFSFEGIFRQAAVIKGRNRDTAWYAAIDKVWPDLQRAFESWLAPENFDEQGTQKTSLSALTSPLLIQTVQEAK